MIRILTIVRTVWLETIRRKEVYVLLILLGALLVTLVSVNIFGLGSVTGYVKDIGLLMVWILTWILAVNVSTHQLPREERQGTIFPLLAKPITRAELIAGKWLGAWSTVTLGMLASYGVLAAVVLFRGGTFHLNTLFQGIVLHTAMLGIISSLGIALSTRMNHDAAASFTYVLTGAAFLVVPRIPGFLANETGMRASALLFLYYLLPHFELFDMRRRLVHGWGPTGWSTILLVLVYGAVLTAACLLLAWLVYRNKRFSMGIVE